MYISNIRRTISKKFRSFAGRSVLLAGLFEPQGIDFIMDSDILIQTTLICMAGTQGIVIHYRHRHYATVLRVVEKLKTLNIIHSMIQANSVTHH